MATFPSVFDLNSLNGSNGFTFTGSGALGFSGFALSEAGDFNGDGFDDLVIGANNVEINDDLGVGETYVIFGSADGFDATLTPSDLDGSNGLRIQGLSAGDRSGSSVSSGDFNGDGLSDLIIGAPNADLGNRFDAGQSYVVFGTASGAADIPVSSLNGSNGFIVNGIGIPGILGNDRSGSAVSSLGDFNGDGIDDFAISSPDADPNGVRSAGQSYVVFGNSDGFGAVLNLSDLNGANGFAINGIGEDGLSGFSLSGAGDVNGDGLNDVVIGAPDVDLEGLQAAGQAYVLFGRGASFESSVDLTDLDGSNGFAINGVSAFDDTGFAVSSAGDINADGIDDLIVSAPEGDPGGAIGINSGEVYVVFGASDGFSAAIDLSSLDGSNGFVVNGGLGISGAGESVDAAGDVNGDGIDDLIVGAPDAGTGDAFVVYGSSAGFAAAVELNALNGSNGFAIDGPSGVDGFGTSVSSAGDLNGDGIDDLAVGTSFFSLGAERNSYVIFGQGDGVVVPDVPLVTIAASAAEAGEPDNDGSFTVARTGEPTEALTVTLAVSGTAEGGVDYEAIATTLTFPIGARFVEIPVSVIDDALVEGTETVTLALVEDDSYDLSEESSATVNITSEDVNTPSEPSEFNFVIGTAGENPLFGGDGRDFIVGTNEDNEIFAGASDDFIFGDADETAGGDDSIFADAGNDLVLAGLGNDLVFGGEGNDTLFGDGGDDLIFGGGGTDILAGGTPAGESSGRDVFAVGAGEGTDIVIDFEVGTDAIALLGGLTFEQIYVVQSGADTVVGAFSGGDPLVVVTNVEASSLTSESFLPFA